MRQNRVPRVSEQASAEQKKRAKRERSAEKRRKKTRDKHRAQGLEHVRKYQHFVSCSSSFPLQVNDELICLLSQDAICPAWFDNVQCYGWYNSISGSWYT